jgi:excisionase family DNA binding protein
MTEIEDTESVAAYLGVPTKTLEQWRYVGKGPAYAKVGKHVRYRRTDVDAWLDAQTVTPAA